MSIINNVAFLHGWGLNRQVWAQVETELGVINPDIKCQLLDLPGYGGAADIDDADNLAVLARHCLAQIHAPAVLVGWSLGGMVAMQAALLDKISADPKVLGLQLITTAPKFVASADWSFGVDLAVFQRFSSELARDYERTLAVFLLLQAGAHIGARALARTAHKAVCELPAPSARALQAGIDCLAKADLRPHLHKIDLPVQVVSGLRDRVAKPESSVKLAQLLGAQLLEFDAGHSPFMTHANGYANALNEFVQLINESSGSSC